MPVAAGTTLPVDIAIQREDAAQSGAVLDERLELRELHLVAGDVRAEGAAAEVVERVLIVGVGVDAGRAGDQRERRHVDGLRGHDGAGGEAVEALALDGPVDDGDVGGPGGAADGAGQMCVDCGGPGGVNVGQAGERQDVGQVGVAHRGVELEGIEIFGLPVAERDGAAEVRLQRAAGEDGIAERGAARRGVDVGGEAREGAVLDGEVGELGVGGDAGRAELAGDGGVDDGGAAVVQRDGEVVAGERTKIVQVAGDDAGLDLLAERAGEIDARVRQLNERLAEQDGVGAAVVVHVQLAGDGHAAASGSDGEVGARDDGVGVLEIAVSLMGPETTPS